jgi:hypothetical protein
LQKLARAAGRSRSLAPAGKRQPSGSVNCAGRVLLSILQFLTLVAPALGRKAYFREMRPIPNSGMTISAPVGLRCLYGTKALFAGPRSGLKRDARGTSAAMITLIGDSPGKVRLPLLVQDPLPVAFSEAPKGVFILDPISRLLFKILLLNTGQQELGAPLVEACSLSSLPLQISTGMEFGPDKGPLRIRESGQ